MRNPALEAMLKEHGGWVLSRCDKTSPRRAGGSAAVKDAPLRAALCGATARSASCFTSRSARHFQSHPNTDERVDHAAIRGRRVRSRFRAVFSRL